MPAKMPPAPVEQTVPQGRRQWGQVPEQVGQVLPAPGEVVAKLTAMAHCQHRQLVRPTTVPVVGCSFSKMENSSSSLPAHVKVKRPVGFRFLARRSGHRPLARPVPISTSMKVPLRLASPTTTVRSSPRRGSGTMAGNRPAPDPTFLGRCACTTTVRAVFGSNFPVKC